MPSSQVTALSDRPASARMARRRLRNRDAIIQSARRLMAERGFARTTISEITEGADLGLGTFYRYFKNKEELLSAVLDEGYGTMLERLRDSHADGLPPHNALRFVSDQFVKTARENDALFAIVFGHGPPALRPAVKFAQAFNLRVRAVLERGIREGAFRPMPASLVAQSLAGLYVQALLWRDESGFCPANELIGVLAPIVEQGISSSNKAKEHVS